LRGSPQVLLGEMRSGPIVGRQKADRLIGAGGVPQKAQGSGRVGRTNDAGRIARPCLGLRPCGRLGQRPDDDEFGARHNDAIVHESLILELHFQLGRVGQGRVELATFQRLQQGLSRSGNELDGNSGIASKATLQRLRQAGIEQRLINAQAHRVDE